MTYLKHSKRRLSAESNITDVRRTFRNLARQIQLFQLFMSHAQDTDRSKFELPAELLQAWIYLLLAIVQGSLDAETHLSHLEKTTNLLKTGMRAILKSLSVSSLLKQSSVLPTEIMSLMSLKLLNDVSNYSTVNNTYSESIKALVS